MPLQNLLSSSASARILFATDEWFACAHNLLLDTPPTFDPDTYCPEGKVMDGWETRRKRIPGHDWCIIELSATGRLKEVEIDTAYFTGNYVPRISLWATRVKDEREMKRIKNQWLGKQGTAASEEEVKRAEAICGRYEWVEILGMTELRAGYEETRYHKFPVSKEVEGATHIRVNYFPDGGVARLKLWAEEVNNVSSSSELVDFAAVENGGRGLGCSNRHYGQPSNLIKPSRGKDMGDGWETARHTNRPPILKLLPNSNLVDFGALMDWAVIALGGMMEKGVEKIVVDTAHFKGNFPESVQVEGCFVEGRGREVDEFVCRPLGTDGEVGWFALLPRVRLKADTEHVFEEELVNKNRKISHVRVTIYPDGGISRIRILGRGPMVNKNFTLSHL